MRPAYHTVARAAARSTGSDDMRKHKRYANARASQYKLVRRARNRATHSALYTETTLQWLRTAQRISWRLR